MECPYTFHNWFLPPVPFIHSTYIQMGSFFFLKKSSFQMLRRSKLQEINKERLNLKIRRVGSSSVISIFNQFVITVYFQEKAGTIFTLVDSSKREHLGML